MEVHYRTANHYDAEQIGQLHALSWQRHYRGIYPDDYLEKTVVEERKKTWEKRFREPNDNMNVIIALNEDRFIGFACTFLDHDPVHGALLDNLHVLMEFQNKGIGKKLIQASAQWVAQHRPGSGIYLYVLQKNQTAYLFYKNLGASLSGILYHENPAGMMDAVIRCSWNPATILL